MVEIPQCKDDALDIVWGCIRNNNEHWLKIFPGALGSTVKNVSQELGWSDSTCRRLMEIMVKNGQLTKRWNHQHQSYWSGHYSTIGERPRGGNPVDLDVSDIPF